MKRGLIILAVLTIVVLGGCRKNRVYEKHKDIENNVWYRLKGNNIVKFEVPVKDTLSNYRILIAVRYMTGFPFTSLKVGMTIYTPDKEEKYIEHSLQLRGETANKEGLEEHENLAEVLLFKQAISLGWDCPRAAVLLIFREYSNATFGVQTVGRILRMPEQKHYQDEMLNHGYVYTNLTKSLITIENEVMYDVVFNKSYRKKIYKNIGLDSTHINVKKFRNRLSSSYYNVFRTTIEKQWGLQKELGGESFTMINHQRLRERMIETDITKMDFAVMVNKEFEGNYGEIIRAEETESFNLYQTEIAELFEKFMYELCGGYAKVDTAPIVKRALLDFLFEEYLALDENTGKKIVLMHRQAFTDIMNQSYQNYEFEIEKKKKEYSQEQEQNKWEVPEILTFDEKYINYQNQLGIMEPLFLFNRGPGKVADSNAEQSFIELLDTGKNQDLIEWWYKNGVGSKEHFSIVYKNNKGRNSLFYVDFVIKFKKGNLALFDTKTIESDDEMVNKHNALIDYIAKRNKEGKETIGGVIVPEKGSWLYCENKIENNYDLTGWTVFEPVKFR